MLPLHQQAVLWWGWDHVTMASRRQTNLNWRLSILDYNIRCDCKVSWQDHDDSRQKTIKIKLDNQIQKDRQPRNKKLHRRLGHSMSLKFIKGLIRKNKLPLVKCNIMDCEPWTKENYRRLFSGSILSAKDVGSFHVDTKCNVDTPSVNGYLYFLTIMDEYRRHTMTNLIKTKMEASELLINFIISFEKQSGHSVEKLQSDNDNEFTLAFQVLKNKLIEIKIHLPTIPKRMD